MPALYVRQDARRHAAFARTTRVENPTLPVG